jgi:ribosome-binding factor A
MPSRRSERVSGLLLQAVAGILLREVKDPRVSGVTVTAATMSGDLRLARIFFRTLQDENGADALIGLQSATGYIRRQIAARLRLRYTPTIEFCYDNTFDEVNHLENLFHKIRQEEY